MSASWQEQATFWSVFRLDWWGGTAPDICASVTTTCNSPIIIMASLVSSSSSIVLQILATYPLLNPATASLTSPRGLFVSFFFILESVYKYLLFSDIGNWNWPQVLVNLWITHTVTLWTRWHTEVSNNCCMTNMSPPKPEHPINTLQSNIGPFTALKYTPCRNFLWIPFVFNNIFWEGRMSALVIVWRAVHYFPSLGWDVQTLAAATATILR